LGDIGTFSFYANKIITCGEGGMVTTDSDEIADRARYYRNICFDKDSAKRFVHEAVGHNFRLTNLQAAVGLAQTRNANRLVEMRRSMARKYLDRFAGMESHLQLPVERPWATNVYWMFGVVLRSRRDLDARKVQELLRARGVDSRRFFCPGHLQPALKQYGQGVDAPVSENLWENGIYLPSPADLTDAEADRVVSALREILRNTWHE
jgi:perosamine synthetase